MGRYIPSTPQQLEKMLSALGMKSMDELYADVPAGMMAEKPDLPDGLSEIELDRKMREYACENAVFDSVFLGAGAYNHYIPSIVKRVAAKETFVTSYTPYQPELSQGVLQSIFEYQGMICELMGMDVANASVYDGATAAAEGIRMCVEKKRPTVLVAANVKPMTLETIKTYCVMGDIELVEIAAKDGLIDAGDLESKLTDASACLYLESPNFYGLFEDVEKIKSLLASKGAKLVLGVNPIASAYYKTAGELGADVCVAEGQPLGLPVSFGGPYLGIMACTKPMMRRLPGRIVGRTHDSQGREAYVLTLQAREQHIRREKASSNICSNEALCAMTAAVYMAAMGPDGMAECAVQCHSKACYLREKLSAIEGFDVVYKGEFFNEFVTSCPVDPVELIDFLAGKGILGGLPIDEGILWCCTEVNTASQIDALAAAIEEALK